MLMKWTGAEFLFASHDGSRRLRLEAGALAHIAYACARPDESAVVLTAAQTRADMADVNANKKGNYRAYLLDAGGLRRLTDEYTNSAIPLERDGVAYSNGRGLVIQTGERRIEHKVGRFNWGPPSISSNENGSLVAMIRWKGDDRKLLICDLETRETVSPPFSVYSYVLVGKTAFHVLSGGIKSFEPRTGASKTITDGRFRRALLKLCNLTSLDDSSIAFRFSDLGLLGGHLVTLVWVVEPQTYRRHACVVLRLSDDLAPAEILFNQPLDDDWRLNDLLFDGGTAVQVQMQRFDENIVLAGTKYVWLGQPSPLLANDDWGTVATPQLPDFGFQFLPQDPLH